MSDPVQTLSAGEALDRVRAGTLVLVDVRPPGERALAAVPVPYESLESGGLERLMARPRDQALAFLCHHGVRSEQAARYFLAQGFREVHNVVGGIEAWACEVDPTIPRY
ncbi:rhodanese-like domain-containing protein [Luteimonas vadosa]|uniref:Rhodanese domain-containing protein n=1 Tax=Luteimonas vadosa TaxID=1165507 RepID=A0ABP9DTD7_9GAMM